MIFEMNLFATIRQESILASYIGCYKMFVIRCSIRIRLRKTSCLKRSVVIIRNLISHKELSL